jgi:hypothetical protein
MELNGTITQWDVYDSFMRQLEEEKASGSDDVTNVVSIGR